MLRSDALTTQPYGLPLSEELAGRGVRLTAQRRILIEIIQGAQNRLDATSLLSKARQRVPDIGRATVYRTIKLLIGLRSKDEMNWMDSPVPRRDQLQLVCFQCGRTEEFSSGAPENQNNPHSNQPTAEIRVARLEVKGRCRACRRQPLKQ